MQTSKWSRIGLGVFLVGYALNQFFHIFPTSYGKMPERALLFLDSVVYYLPYLYLFEIVVGVLLMINKWTSALLIMIFPLSFSFLMFTLINSDFGEMWPALIVAILNLYLLVTNKDKYMPLFD